MTDNDDLWMGQIPFEVVPEEIQAIVNNDAVNRDYLKKINPLRFDEEDGKVETFEQIKEHNLILWFWDRIRSNRLRSTTTTSTSTEATSTTSKYRESKNGKGTFYRSSTGKCFLKRKFEHDSPKNGDEESDDGSQKRFKNINHLQKQLQQKLKINNKCYTVKNSYSSQLPFPADESLVTMNVLNSIIKYIK